VVGTLFTETSVMFALDQLVVVLKWTGSRPMLRSHLGHQNSRVAEDRRSLRHRNARQDAHRSLAWVLDSPVVARAR